MQNEPLLDFDMPYAFMNRDSRLHKTAEGVFSKIREEEIEPAFSTIGFIELEVVYRSLERPSSEVVEDCAALRMMNLEILPLPPGVVISAAHLRDVYDLSLWDSHYAAHALTEDRPVISTDSAFDEVEDLERIEPEDLL